MAEAVYKRTGNDCKNNYGSNIFARICGPRMKFGKQF